MKKMIIALFAVTITAITSCGGIFGGKEANTADSTMACIDSTCADTVVVAVDSTKLDTIKK